MSNIEVIGIGAINIDCLCQVKELVTDSETVMEHIKTAPGGSAANTIYGLAKLGIRTGFIGSIGDDAEGKASVRDLEAVGIDTSQVQIKKGEKTGYALCLSDKLGRRSIYVLPGANNMLEWKDVSLTYLNQAKIVHLSSFVEDKQFSIQIKLVEKLSNSVKISFAPGVLYAIKGIKALSPLLSRTHILFINREEIEQLTGKDFTTGAKECLQLGCEIVVVTLGKGLASESGKIFTSYICHGKKEYKIESRLRHCEAFPLRHCEVLPFRHCEERVSRSPERSKGDEAIPGEAQPEATGAGDAFAAGFLFGFLKGGKLEQCGQLGDRMARYAMSKAGAREGLPGLNIILGE